MYMLQGELIPKASLSSINTCYYVGDRIKNANLPNPLKIYHPLLMPMIPKGTAWTKTKRINTNMFINANECKPNISYSITEHNFIYAEVNGSLPSYISGTYQFAYTEFGDSFRNFLIDGNPDNVFIEIGGGSGASSGDGLTVEQVKAIKVNAAVDADTVNGKTVLVNVPYGAVFTDTVTSINGKTGAIVKADIVALGLPAQARTDSEINNLITSAMNGHTHTIANVTGLATALSSKALLAGSITQDFSTKALNVSGNIVPSTNGSYDLGSVSNRFKSIYVDELFLSNSTLYLGTDPLIGRVGDTFNIKSNDDKSINVETTGIGISTITSANRTNVTTNGNGAHLFIDAIGVNSDVNINATRNINLDASNVNVTGIFDVNGETTLDNLTIRGNLIVSGDSFTVNAATVQVEDNIILLNKGEIGSTVTSGNAGIEIDRGSGTNYLIQFNEGTDKTQIGFAGNLKNVLTEDDLPPTPTPPSTLTISEFADRIDIVFDEVAGMDRYEVWSSVGDESNYDLIDIINENQIIPTMTISDNSYGVKTGIVYYKVYSFIEGIQSVAVSGSVTLAIQTTLDVTNLNVLAQEESILASWEIPSDVRVSHIEVFVGVSATTTVTKPGSPIATGYLDSYQYNISPTDNDKYFKLWVDLIMK